MPEKEKQAVISQFMLVQSIVGLSLCNEIVSSVSLLWKEVKEQKKGI